MNNDLKWFAIMMAVIFGSMFGYFAIDAIVSTNADTRRYEACIANHSPDECNDSAAKKKSDR